MSEPKYTSTGMPLRIGKEPNEGFVGLMPSHIGSTEHGAKSSSRSQYDEDDYITMMPKRLNLGDRVSKFGKDYAFPLTSITEDLTGDNQHPLVDAANSVDGFISAGVANPATRAFYMPIKRATNAMNSAPKWLSYHNDPNKDHLLNIGNNYWPNEDYWKDFGKALRWRATPEQEANLQNKSIEELNRTIRFFTTPDKLPFVDF
jgi:hypothetical protein